jgi:hypothetical protein
MAPGDISSESPVVASPPRGNAQNWPLKRGKSRKQAAASGAAMSRARAESRNAARTGRPDPECATIIMAAQAPQSRSR